MEDDSHLVREWVFNECLKEDKIVLDKIMFERCFPGPVAEAKKVLEAFCEERNLRLKIHGEEKQFEFLLIERN